MYSSTRSYSLDINSTNEPHKLHIHEWGKQKNEKVILCLHGLTRCSLDFGPFGTFFSKDYRVVCPDLVGRGRSSWLVNKSLYQIPFYLRDICFLIDRLKSEDITLVGTSLGGILAMFLCSKKTIFSDSFFFSRDDVVSLEEIKEKTNFSKLILNDIGATVNFRELLRLNYATSFDKEFYSSEKEAEKSVKKNFREFGPHSESEWKFLTQSYIRYDSETRRFVPHFDPGILNPYGLPAIFNELSSIGIQALPDLDLWEVFDQICLPTLLLKGAESSILKKELANEMTERGPKPKLVEFQNVGHAPTLIDQNQLYVVKNFFNS